MKNRIETERKFWDYYAKRYDGFVWGNASATYKYLLQKLENDTSKTNKLLEIATGTGIIALHLSKSISKVTAIDISPEMIKVAKTKSTENSISNIEFKVGDSCNIEFEDKTFDTIIASNLLHLLFEPGLALKEMKRVLTDDGQIILPTYCHGSNIKSHILSRLMGLFGFRARNRWSPASFKNFIKNNGFEIVEYELIKDKIPMIYVVARKAS